MAIKNRGLTNAESLGLSKASITASGLEAAVSSPAFLYKVVVSESGGTEDVIAKIADNTASGTKATLEVSLGSGTSVDRTKEVTFDPPLHFSTGIFVSSTGLNAGLLSFGYKS